MKKLACALIALGLLATASTEADAVVCARGPYRAGCAGPHGAVVAPRGYARPVVAPRCYWRGGVRVCR